MIIYYGRDTKRIIEELVETRPTYLPSVPRIFEKLYTAAIKMRDASGDTDRESFEQADQARRRGSPPPSGRRGRARRDGARVPGRRRASLFPCPGAVRRRDHPSRDRRRTDRRRDPRVLLRLRGPGARGLGDDRDHSRRHGVHAREVQVRHGRAADARRRGQDRRRGSGDPRARAERVRRVLAQPRRYGRGARSTAGCRPAMSANSTTRASSRSPAARRTSSSPPAART